MSTNKRGKFVCDKCKKVKDPVYFVGKKELCEDCRTEGENINDMAQFKRRSINRAKVEKES